MSLTKKTKQKWTYAHFKTKNTIQKQYSPAHPITCIIVSLKMQINALINNVPMSKSALLLVLWEVLILRVHVLQLCVKIEITNFKV